MNFVCHPRSRVEFRASGHRSRGGRSGADEVGYASAAWCGCCGAACRRDSRVCCRAGGCRSRGGRGRADEVGYASAARCGCCGAACRRDSRVRCRAGGCRSRRGWCDRSVRCVGVRRALCAPGCPCPPSGDGRNLLGAWRVGCLAPVSCVPCLLAAHWEPRATRQSLGLTVRSVTRCLARAGRVKMSTGFAAVEGHRRLRAALALAQACVPLAFASA